MLTHEFNSSTSISGVNGGEVLAGLHWYLKYWCNVHVSWDKTGGVQLQSLPQSGNFPCVQDAGIVNQRPVPWNYYQNAVTSSCKILFMTIVLMFLIILSRQLHELPHGTISSVMFQLFYLFTNHND